MNIIKQTKVVATISDLRCDVSFIKELFKSGMNVVRMNTAHVTEEGFYKVINNVREVSDKIAILVDTKGPEIRTTTAKETIKLTTGDKIKIQGNKNGISSNETLYLSYENIANELSIGNHILIDDGEIDLLVIEKDNNSITCQAQNEGEIGSRKSVNIPGVKINLPSVTEKDHQNIILAIKNNVDFIAHSFVRDKEDVLAIQKILDEHKSEIKIIAKIENQEGIDNIDEILNHAYGIMVARGDLGIEVPQEKIPVIQKKLISKAIKSKKPVIVATQMLHSMIKNPRPTRAEISDIANAVYYHTDAVMLSGETAYGKYPLESLKTMVKVIIEAEKSKTNSDSIPIPYNPGGEREVTSFLAKQAVKAIYKLNVKTIFTDSHTGYTARVLSSFRGTCHLFAVATTEKLARELAICYGINAEYIPGIDETRESRISYYTYAIKSLIKKGIIKEEDRVAYIGGSFGSSGGTTYIDINEAWKILQANNKYNLPSYN